LDYAADARAKVVLVGDDKQFAAIEAGGGFRGLRLRLGAVTLTENRRQAEPWDGHKSQGTTLDEALVRVTSAEDGQWLHVGGTRAIVRTRYYSVISPEPAIRAAGASPSASLAVRSTARQAVGVEATKPNSPGWSPSTARSLRQSPPSGSTTGRSRSTAASGCRRRPARPGRRVRQCARRPAVHSCHDRPTFSPEAAIRLRVGDEGVVRHARFR
jgi:AAA domain-containing protein